MVAQSLRDFDGEVLGPTALVAPIIDITLINPNMFHNVCGCFVHRVKLLTNVLTLHTTTVAIDARAASALPGQPDELYRQKPGNRR